MYDRMRQDTARILGTGFTLAVVFTSPTGIEYQTNAFFSDIGMGFDANGMPTPERRIALSAACVLADGTVVFNESTWPKGDGWRVAFTYNGVAFYGEVLNAMLDRSMGCVTLNAGKVRKTS